jgi:hypothetical protein
MRAKVEEESSVIQNVRPSLTALSPWCDAATAVDSRELTSRSEASWSFHRTIVSIRGGKDLPFARSAADDEIKSGEVGDTAPTWRLLQTNLARSMNCLEWLADEKVWS